MYADNNIKRWLIRSKIECDVWAHRSQIIIADKTKIKINKSEIQKLKKQRESREILLGHFNYKYIYIYIHPHVNSYRLRLAI